MPENFEEAIDVQYLSHLSRSGIIARIESVALHRCEPDLRSAEAFICEWMTYGHIEDLLQYQEALLRELVRRNDPALKPCAGCQARIDEHRRKARIAALAKHGYRHVEGSARYDAPRSETVKELLG